MLIVPDGSAFDDWRELRSFTRFLPAWADCVPEFYGGSRALYEQDVLKVAHFVEASRVGQLVLGEVRTRVRVTPYYPKSPCEVNAEVPPGGNTIFFTPALYWAGSRRPASRRGCPRSPSRSDSALLHELIHVIRRRAGHPSGRRVGRWYFSEEEVFAVLVQNYYNQERSLPPRRSHHGFAPLTVTDRIWLRQSPDERRTYRDFVERFVNDHETLARGLAALDVGFNPIARVTGQAASAA